MNHLLTDRDLDAPWEPRTFKVGDRVRIRLSGECRTLFGSKNIPRGAPVVEHAYALVFRTIPHNSDEDGQTGVIREHNPDPLESHPYMVEYDQPIERDDSRLRAAIYAAIELESLDE